MIGEDIWTLTSKRSGFVWRAVTVLALVALAAIVWYTADVFLLAFAGVLLAVFLDFLAQKLAEVWPLGRGWAFATVTTAIAVLLGLAVWISIPHVSRQVDQLIRYLPEGFERLRSELEKDQWGRTLLSFIPGMVASANITGKITTIVSMVFQGAEALAVTAVVGIYVGANPGLYERGLLTLFSERRRPRAREVLGEVGYTLRWWLLGQLIPMAVLGGATIIGLRLLGIRLAFTLGLFTAFMVFIPYIGSLIALTVTALVSLLQGPGHVLSVVAFFVGIHTAEGYLLTPLVQRRAVYLPPGLTILAQVLMGLLLGFLGLALATPITAAAMVLVKMLYLHQRPQHH
ncbi:MAG TPA: AI-2E family transporter [Bryobacteraceae bacterium]|nr:AI-2E family transporter [Bryobacteraceae bacterium]